jgi:signal transduction histidine kinase
MNSFSNLSSIRVKMLLFMGLILALFLILILQSQLVIQEVKVGGGQYRTIQEYNQIVQDTYKLKSDLTQARVITLTLLLAKNADQVQAIRQQFSGIVADADASFTSIQNTHHDPALLFALHDAEFTWHEFVKTTFDEIIPSIKAGDSERARLLARDIQEQRYSRFIEQVSCASDISALEIRAIENDTGRKITRTLRYMSVSSVALVLACVLLTILIIRFITGPIIALSRMMKTISQNRDYSLRTAIHSGDEFGQLADGFNEMLGRIQAHAQERDGYANLLEEQVKERTAALKNSNAQLEEELQQRKLAEEEKDKLYHQLVNAEKQAALGRLAGGVAHDFNNLLTVMRGNAELVLAGCPAGSQLRTDITEVLQAANRAVELTHQLLLYSRKQPLQSTALVDINASIANTLKLLSRVIGENIKISLDLSPELWPVMIDDTQFAQIFMNLSINAQDAMPDGGVLSIKTKNIVFSEEDTAVMLRSNPGQYVRISIGDTGLGMDKETMDHIFEPFFTTKGVGKGTGLGLSVVYGIVEQHGGWINVYSHPGQGTVFNVYLKGSREKIEAQKADVHDSPYIIPGKGKRILLVEDETAVRELGVKVLSKHGYTIVPCATKGEALQVFRTDKNFHLVLSDIILPDGTGVELVEEIISSAPAMPILLVSGYFDKKGQWDIIEQHHFRFMQKPYTIQELLQTVQGLVFR